MNISKLHISMTVLVGLLTLGALLALWGTLAGDPPLAQAQGSTRYVSSVSGQDSGDCTNSTQPCRTIQYAVDQAAGGDEVHIAAYDVSGSVALPVIVTTTARYTGAGTNIITLNKSLTLRGGYVYAHLPGLPVVWTPGILPAQVDGEGARRGLYVSGDVTPTLQLLAFVRGHGDWGGNVYAEDANLQFIATPILSGTAAYGGGLYLKNCHVLFDPGDVQWQELLGISGLLLVQGNAAQYGGGLYVEGGAPTLAGLALYANSATADGGGLYLQGGHPDIAGGLVLGNQAGDRGGGLFLADSAARIVAMAVYSNTAANGAGLYVDGPYSFSESTIPVIANSYIRYNRTTGSQGGGLYLRQAIAGLVNNVIADNQAADGAGLYLWASSPQLFHNTLAQNDGDSGVYLTHSPGSIWPPIPPIPSYPSFTNTIVASHTVGVYVDSTGLPSPLQNQATLAGTLWWGNATDAAGPGLVARSGDVLGDPRFTCTGNLADCLLPYHILTDSAAVDAGVIVNLSLPGADLFVDIDGQSRPSGAGYDIGADEVVNEDYSVWLIPPLSARIALPGETVTHTHWLMNTGVETDTYDLAFASDQGWATLLAATPVTLSPQESITVHVRVDVPTAATGGQWDTSHITATSQADPDQRARAIDVTTVITGEVNLAVTKQASATRIMPGDVVTFTIALTVAGGPLTEPMTATLTDVMAPPQAIAAVRLPAGCTGNPATGLFTCTRTLPVDVPSLTTTLTAVVTTSQTYTGLLVNSAVVRPSQGFVDADLTDNTALAAVVVSETWRAWLAPPISLRTALPGETVVHTQHLVNAGSETDTYDLVLAAERGWATLLAPTPITVSALSSVTVAVQVAVPLTATGGQWETSRITATSRAYPDLQAVAVQVTTVISPAGQVNLAVTKQAHAAAIDAGDAVTYTVAFTIAGGPFAEPVTATLTDALVPSAAIASWQLPAGCQGDLGTGLITCDQALPGGTPTLTATLTVVVASSPVYSGTLANTITIAPPPDWIDPDPADNTGQATVNVVAQPHYDLYLPLVLRGYGP